MSYTQETLYTMALTRVPRLNLLNQHLILEALGSATAVYENRKQLQSLLPHATPVLLDNLAQMDTLLPRAEQEMAWCQDKQIACLCLHEAAYPARLRECDDAPLVLYYRGNADLNKAHVLNMVGTRQCTEYGKDLCRTFLEDLARLCPGCLVVSGLAYGVDIQAHRNALQRGLHTVGVLAHGLDQIYPRLHRKEAEQMLTQGGLLTEYMSHTPADKMNFVARNRIVAGMCEATVVVESPAKGGSLITADLACDYNRDVYAFPGRIGDTYSAGCNQLIAQHKAQLITSAQDFMDYVGWQSQAATDTARHKPVQRELFPELSPEEERVVQALKGCDGKAMNQLVIDTCIAIGPLSALLFQMEMRGLVKMMVGGMYRLL